MSTLKVNLLRQHDLQCTSVTYFSSLKQLLLIYITQLFWSCTPTHGMSPRVRLGLSTAPVSDPSSSSVGSNRNIAKEHSLFLRRDAMRKRCLCCRPVSVCPFVCPSRSCIASRQLKISSNFFLGPVAPSLTLFDSKRFTVT